MTSLLARSLRVWVMACATTFVAAAPAAAGVFTLNWSGDPSRDADLIASNDFSARAVGSITVGVGAGQSFGRGDVTAAELTISRAAFGSFVFDLADLVYSAGRISADGGSIFFDDLYFADGGDASASQFGCNSTAGDCRLAAGMHLVMRLGAGAGGDGEFVYTSSAAALASFTESGRGGGSVPTPATWALVLLGLVAVAAQRPRHSCG
jgi:hypothetical protein